ncbi:acetyl/propionyl/methylcrotonyl-CoA carboxylase subunit alpha [Pseudoxanthomonas winnipegensis]|uniref:acetyl/propionyl/methylcrotonyl-CoA carboxylase subunit alpha n=1 Tax=Pseudoxanthomonas winnipegensis TaxID=2480810 RepID=UPI00103901BC|nr:biotin carboxylase N-terminal domain-containing protein [Pseudoxanthomonas winnipegensis]TBV72849.1 ATP-grasp domain-containing protein [Pseudoxanthomonas winnipegensis]
MIESLLIANRGEIARRILRTAQRLGVRTIAVYSEADAGLPFVREADQAVCIGPAPARESYLSADKLLAAARQTGAAAIHPGYGFLSENAEFADAVIAAGLVWVGAPPASIRAMGRKDAAKARMQAAGVPVTPGYLGEDQSTQRLQREADAIGYPVLIKAVSGGGGKGMRKVDAAADFAAALDSCRREAAAAFGDDRVLLEKYVSNPRHIEVQVFGDTRGNVVHLFERDCSLQRRHQKVIEEAPAPGMDAATRQALCAAAVKAARAVDYVGAGTIEFIADGSQGLRADAIWFMEMNTRLQVEHPVTESITGQDLVEWQLRVASGEALPLAQDQLAIHGWAMEARLYAENPSNGFLPSIGPLERLRLPEDIRVDSGVEEGGEVSPFYDPMIAKLIAHAPTRAQAARRLAQACAQVQVWPVRTNAAFLARTATHPQFVAGQVDTGFIARHLDALLPPAVPPPALLDQAASALLPAPDGSPWTALRGFRANAPREHRAAVRVGEAIHLAQWHAGPAPALVTVEGTQLLFDAGQAWPVAVPALGEAGAAGETGDGALLAPMPGRIVAVQVVQGEQVTRGQALVVLEAMKMEQTLQSPFAGTVRELSVQVGAQVSEGKVLLVIEQEQAA